VFIARARAVRDWWAAHPQSRSTILLKPLNVVQAYACTGESSDEAEWRIRAEKFLRLPKQGRPADWLWSGWVADARRLLDDLEALLLPQPERRRQPDLEQKFERFVDCHFSGGRKVKDVAKNPGTGRAHVHPSRLSNDYNFVARRLGVKTNTPPSRLGAKDERPRKRRRNT
jgi:hypothetical protein